MKNDIYVRLRAILPLAKHVSSHPVYFPARGEVRVDTVVHSSPHLYAKSILAVIRGLGQDVSPANDRMRPGFPFAGAPGDFWAAAVADVFDVLVLVDRGRESGVDATLDRKPLVREIGNAGIGPHTRGVESRGAQPHQREP